MNNRGNFSKHLSVFVLLTLYAVSTFGWGKTGHQIISGNFTNLLPSPLSALSKMSSYYVQHASDADYRKNSDPSEGPKHFMDMDYYPEFKTGTLTHNLDSLIAKYGSVTVTNNGILPWAISSVYDSVVVYMHNGDWNDANRLIADLGHYVGDAFQPLHCTQNYDGKLTGNSGIHSRFETKLLDAYANQVSIQRRTVEKTNSSPLEYAFQIITQSNSKVQPILDADSYAKSIDPNYGTAYYNSLWSKLDSLMIRQLQGASEALASLVYSAWLDAGSPVITRISAQTPSTFYISERYPNPFNPSTNIKIIIPQSFSPSNVRVSAYSLDGKMVKNENLILHPGNNSLPLNFTGFPSGTYLVAVEIAQSGWKERRTLKAVLVK